MKVIIVTGKLQSGKSTVSETLKGTLKEKYTVGRISFSQSLSTVLDLFGIDKERRNYSSLSTILKDTYGEDILRKAVLIQLESAGEFDYVFIDGARYPADIDILEQFKPIIIGVQATEETRFQRARAAGKDGYQTLGELRAAEAMETEGDIDSLLERADIIIKNDGGLEELGTELLEVLRQLQQETTEIKQEIKPFKLK